MNRYLKCLSYLSIWLAFYFINPNFAFSAYSMSIIGVTPNTISSPDDEMSTSLEIVDLPAGVFYLRVALKVSEASTQYFGKMRNDHGEWIDIKPLNEQGYCPNYYQVTGPLTGVINITVKMGEERQAGVYYLRAHKISENCANSDNSNHVQITHNPSPTSTPTSSISPTNTSAPVPTPTIAADYPQNILVSEFMAYPEDDQEWVEIFNNNDYQVNLVNWQIGDSLDSHKKIFSAVINAKSYYVIQGNIYLNKSSPDAVRLFYPSGEIANEPINYNDCDSDHTWSLVNNDWCLADPTKGNPNGSCWEEEDDSPDPTNTPPLTHTPTPSRTPTPKKTPTPTKTRDQILGASGSAEATASSGSAFFDLCHPTESPSTSSAGKRDIISYLPWILIGTGTVLSAASGGLYWWKRKPN